MGGALIKEEEDRAETQMDWTSKLEEQRQVVLEGNHSQELRR
jgi:hypothetical protein